jgi:hypothetical protein
MIQTAEQLMCGCGLKMTYAFTQSDEISLLFGPDEDGFGRRLRKPAVGPLRRGDAELLCHAAGCRLIAGQG